MEWRRFGYSAEFKDLPFEDEGWFYQVHTYTDMNIGTEELDENEQGPFDTEEEAMAHLEAWIDEQYEEGKVEEMQGVRLPKKRQRA